LADLYVGYCRELEWIISRQKLQAMRHAFHAISAYDSEADRLTELRRDVLMRTSGITQNRPMVIT